MNVSERIRFKFTSDFPLKYGVNAAAEFDDPDWPRFVRITDVTPNGGLREDTFRSLPPEVASGYELEAGDILLARSGATVGKTFIYDPSWGKACYAGYLIRSRTSESYWPKFIYWYFQSTEYWSEIQSNLIQATIQNFSAEKYANIRILSLPLDTQKRIAAFLDDKTAQIDGLIARKQALLERLAEKRQAIITQAVTKGLNSAATMKDSGIDWLGQIPAHWEVKRLKRVKRFLTSGSRGWGDYYSDEGDIFLRMTNVTKGGVEIDAKDLRHVTLDGVREGTRTATQVGDILITITAELGSVAIVRAAHAGAYINQHIALFRPDQSECDPEYLVNFLWSDVTKTQFELSGQGGTKQGLGFDQVDNVMIALPPLAEQREIAREVAASRNEFDVVEVLVSRSITSLIEYRSALITSAVTGQIEGLR